MKMYKMYVYSDAKTFYFKYKAGLEKKKERLQRINPYDLYVIEEISVSEDR